MSDEPSKKQAIVDALIRAIWMSAVRMHVDLDRVRYIIESGFDAMYSDGIVHLELLMLTLAAQTGVTDEMAAEPLLMFAWRANDLGVRAELPRSLLEHEQLGVWRRDAVEKLGARSLLDGDAPGTSKAKRGLETAQFARDLIDKATANIRAATETVAWHARRAVRLGLSSIAAVLSVTLAIVATWWVLHNDAEPFVAPEIEGGIKLADGTRDGSGATLVIVDAAWESMPERERRAAVGSLFMALREQGIDGLTLVLSDRSVAATANETPYGIVISAYDRTK